MLINVVSSFLQFFIASSIGLIGLVAPNSNSRVVGAGDERIDLLNYLDLVDPVHVIVEVCHQRHTSRTIRLLHHVVVNVPNFD